MNASNTTPIVSEEPTNEATITEEETDVIFFMVSDQLPKRSCYANPGMVNPESPERRDQIPSLQLYPTIEQALLGFGSWEGVKNLRVYEIDTDEAFPADWIEEYEITGEHRLYSGAELDYVGTVDVDKLGPSLAEESEFTDLVAKLLHLKGLQLLQSKV